MRKGDYAKALEKFRYLTEEARTWKGGKLYHEFAYHDFGLCWWLNGSISDAHEILSTSAANIDKDSRYYADAHGNLGTLLMEIDLMDQGVHYLEKCLQVGQHSSIFYNNLGVAYTIQRRFKDAMDAFSQGLREDYPDQVYEKHFVPLLQSNINKLDQRMKYPMKPKGTIKMHYAIVMSLITWHDKGITRIIDI